MTDPENSLRDREEEKLNRIGETWENARDSLLRWEWEGGAVLASPSADEQRHVELAGRRARQRQVDDVDVTR